MSTAMYVFCVLSVIGTFCSMAVYSGGSVVLFWALLGSGAASSCLFAAVGRLLDEAEGTRKMLVWLVQERERERQKRERGD